MADKKTGDKRGWPPSPINQLVYDEDFLVIPYKGPVHTPSCLGNQQDVKKLQRRIRFYRGNYKDTINNADDIERQNGCRRQSTYQDYVYTSVEHAAALGHLECLKLIFEEAKHPSDLSVLRKCVRLALVCYKKINNENRIGVVQYCLSRQKFIPKIDAECWISLLKHGNNDLLKMLLELGCTLSDEDYMDPFTYYEKCSSLSSALYNNNLDAAVLLLLNRKSLKKTPDNKNFNQCLKISFYTFLKVTDIKLLMQALKIFKMFGGNFWFIEINRQKFCILDDIYQNERLLPKLMPVMSELEELVRTPLSLKATCRLAVKETFGRDFWKIGDTLNATTNLRNYLKFQELITGYRPKNWREPSPQNHPHYRCCFTGEQSSGQYQWWVQTRPRSSSIINTTVSVPVPPSPAQPMSDKPATSERINQLSSQPIKEIIVVEKPSTTLSDESRISNFEQPAGTLNQIVEPNQSNVGSQQNGKKRSHQPTRESGCKKAKRSGHCLNQDEEQVINMAEQQADWRDAEMSVVQKEAYMLEKDLCTDCTFRVGPDDNTAQVFRAHKFVLARASSDFEVMFFGTQEAGEVRVTDLEPATFKVMLSYIYTGRVSPGLNLAEIISLTRAAKKFSVSGLVRVCIQTIINEMKPCDVWACLQLSEVLGDPQLKEAAFKELRDCTEEALSSLAFLDIPYSTLVTVVQQDILTISSEMVVIEACLRWARHQCEQADLKAKGPILRDLMGPEVVSRLRLLSLSLEEFASGPGDQNWLNADEKASVYQCLAAPNIGKLCEQLCANKEPRPGH